MIESRLALIMSALETRGRVSVRELSDLLGVSEVTIRQDLIRLENNQQIRRVRGGAAIPVFKRPENLIKGNTSLPYSLERYRIAQLAASLIEQDDVLILDAGTATREMVRFIKPSSQDLTIITNGMDIALELEQLYNISVYIMGGMLRGNQVSPIGEDLFARFLVSKLFLDPQGVHADFGVTTRNLPDAEIKQTMIQHAHQVYLLAEPGKLGVVSNSRIAPIEKITCIITDRTATEEQLRPFREKGIDIRQA